MVPQSVALYSVPFPSNIGFAKEAATASGLLFMSSFGAASANPWMRVLDALEKKVNRNSYETWLKPTRYDHAQGAVLFVRVPNPEFCHIGERYGDLISEAMENLGMEYLDVEFVTEEEPPKKAKAIAADGAHNQAPASLEKPVASQIGRAHV